MIIDIYDYLKLKGMKGVQRKANNEIGFCCPFHKDNTPSVNFNTKDNIFHCFGCGEKGTLIDFIARIENIGIDDAIRIAKRSGVTPAEIDLMLEIKKRLAPDEPEKILEEIELDPFKGMMHTSMLDRVEGDKEVLKEFEIGYSKKDKRITIPVRSVKNELVGIIGRTTNGSAAKYNTLVPQKGFRKSKHLFGLNKCKDKKIILLCEGPLDAVHCYHHKFNFAAAIMGSQFSEEQHRLLTSYATDVILALDNDEVGRKSANEIIEKLRGSVNMYKFKYIVDKKDPGSLTQEEIGQGIEKAERVL